VLEFIFIFWACESRNHVSCKFFSQMWKIYFFPCVQANRILSIKLIGSRMLSRQVGAWLWIWTTISTPQISKISQFISLRISCSRHWILSTIHTTKNLGFSNLKIQHWTWHELPLLSSFHLMLCKSYWAVLK